MTVARVVSRAFILTPTLSDAIYRSVIVGRVLHASVLAGGGLNQTLVANGRQLLAPVRKFHSCGGPNISRRRMDALTPISRQPHAFLHHMDSCCVIVRPFATNIDPNKLEESKEFWRRLIEKKTMDDDTVGAAEAEMKYHDTDMQLHDTKAEIARANGNHEEAQKAEMAKNKAEMAKNKAEMAKNKAEMAKAKAAGDTEGEQLAREEIQRAKAEYDAAKKVHDALLEQVTQGGKGVFPMTTAYNAGPVISLTIVLCHLQNVSPLIRYN
jgi:hypothetical protein